MEYSTLGAVDLGSNSFHLAVGRIDGDQVYPLDSLKETVRLGSGITKEKLLDEPTQARALEALRKFAERLAGMPRDTVRVVGTNALRVAKNSAAFLREAERTLGFPIDVISGREEARLIYLGVVHSLPLADHNRLVIDIGGGSTEFIIGHRLKPVAMESLYMGCVSFTRRFFGDGKLDKKSMKTAELSAREQVQTLAARFERVGWQDAVASSGTARSMAEILLANGKAARGINADGLEWLKEKLVDAGELKKLSLPGLREDRIPVIPGGVAIMSAIFRELSLKEMAVAEGALRDGVLWDLLGRAHQRDIRQVTVERFMRRYHVDQTQARRVGTLALALLQQLDTDKSEDLASRRIYLDWAAKLHEVGISISQGDYHKHSAYMLANADMPGFSRQGQAWLANLVLAQRGKLSKMREALEEDPRLAVFAFCLRLGVIFHRSRRDVQPPKLAVSHKAKTFSLEIEEAAWLEDHPLVAIALESEREYWSAVGYTLECKEV